MDTEKLMALMKEKKQSMKRVERAEGFKPGKNRIRIAPGWRAGEEHVWYHDFGQHFIKDAADQIQAVYLCNDITFGKPCAVCAAVKGAMRLVGDDETAKVVAKSVAGKAILINAFHLDSDQPNTPRVTAVKPKLFTQLIEMLEENGPEAFFDPNNGHEIVVVRDGKGLNTTYTATMAIKVGTPIPAAAYKQLNNLDEYVAQQSEEQERRAIGAINTVAGLAAPSVPQTSPSSMLPPPVTTPIGPAMTSVSSAAAVAVADGDIDLDTELDGLLDDDLPS